MKASLALVLVLVAVVACGKSAAKQTGVPCDSAALEALATDLHKANGFDVDLQDPKVQADIATAAKEIDGKKYAFAGCKFSSQGNDIVSFAPSSGDAPDVHCQMKGGADGVTKFRRAAMKIDMAKLKLDVSGVIGKDKDLGRFGMTECTIAVHD